MKYQCLEQNCEAVFLFPAKEFDKLLSGSVCLDGTMHETMVCPHCHSKLFKEYEDTEPDITSVKSVELSQVDEFLAQGYVVRELYAKTATLVKLEAKA